MTGGSSSHETTSEESNGVATDFVSEGIIGSYTNTSGVAPATGAFAVNAQGTPDMTVAVSSGVAYVTGTPTSQNSQTFRVYNSASSNVTISANSSGSTKYDWVYIKLDATLLANPTLAGTTTGTLVTSRSTSSVTDDGTPPTYGYPVAVVTVANGAVSITNSTIRDIRATASIGTAAGIATGWNETGLPAVSSVTNNGNRSYDITFASTVASLLSPGMRLRTTRTVSAPAGSFYCDGVNDYLTKTTPNKLSFTDDFVVSAWVKLLAYPTAGSFGVVMSAGSSASGWALWITDAGQVLLNGRNAAAINFSRVTSYQSIPLNKWVHITAQLDMSAFTATTTTSYVMIDGVDVPASVSRGGTNPTALVQAGNLEIGRLAGDALYYFNGRIAQVAVFNAKVTQATMRGYISQGLSGSETSLASAYSGATLLDLNTTTPNDLTANGGALNGQGYSPFGDDYASLTTDYALVMKVSTTTATVQVPEGCTIPTSGGVSAVAYSTTTSPFGFTLDKGRWDIACILKTNIYQAAVTTGVIYNPGGLYISKPTGKFAFYADFTANLTGNTDAAKTIDFNLSESSTAFSTGSLVLTQANDYEIVDVLRLHYNKNPIVFDAEAATTYYPLLLGAGTGTLTNLGFFASSSPGSLWMRPQGI